MVRPSKQAIDISFAHGLDTKTDPKRVQIGNFKLLENSIFDRVGQLQKRNGYKKLSALPDSSSTFLTSFNNNLTAIGTSISAYNSGNSTWVSKGRIQPLSLSTLPILRNNFNQSACDSAVSANGLVCTAYIETNAGSSTNKYVISDAVTGQNIVAPIAIPVSAGTVSGGMRVFFLGNNFVIVFTNTITATAHLQYITVNSYVPTQVSANTDIASSYIAATTLSWDGFVADNALYISYNTTSGGQSIKIAKLTSGLSLTTATTFAGYSATIMSVTADTTNPAAIRVYGSFWATATGLFTFCVDSNLNVVMNPVRLLASGTAIVNIASAAQNGTCQVFYEITNNYSFGTPLPTNYIASKSVTPLTMSFNSIFSSGAGAITVSSATGLVNGMYLSDNTTPAHIAAGTTFTVSGTTLTLSINTAGNSAANPGDSLTSATISSQVIIVRSVGLASKAFIINDVIYFLSAFQSAYQPSYFLINGTFSTSASPVIAAKLAYSNGGGYLTKGLPSVTISGSAAKIAYLFKDLIAPVNKDTNPPSDTQTAGVYSQTGVNLATFDIGTQGINGAEIGNDLHLTGGFLWMYDGYLPVEHMFFLYPDIDTTTPTANAVWSATGGSIHAQPDGATNTNAYYYVFTYEWTDNQGNAFRSAPSIPVAVTTTSNGTSGSITLNVPTLRLTYKISSPVKVSIYRWSVAQEVYYQTTSITSPVLNDTTVDSVQFVDTNADATILGNSILYTTGGIVENIAAPAANLITLFDTRLWLVDAEDPNLLWFSKQVIENTPVEMSDLFTIYVAPTIGAQGSTGPITAFAPMDDKLILFKQSTGNGIYYINGTGPDNTGANNQYSQPIFITSTVGCSNQKSIVFIPEGLLFQSDKGIWLLDRSLNTSYIGAPVQEFTTGALVESAQNIPGTNQVRFILDSGITLMYDYFYGQWGTFKGVPGISSCIFEDLHTFLNALGIVYQENPGSYLDGSNPVLMSFITGPIRVGDMQNFQRTFFYYLLGDYITPHKLLVSNYFDYSDTASNSKLIVPTNYSPMLGNVSPFGQQTVLGGPSRSENWRVFANRRCMALAIGVQEIYDPSFGVPAGAGLTLSGISLVCGFKSPFRTIAASNSI